MELLGKEKLKVENLIMNIKGKNIILTGAKRIGKSVAESLIENGANLTVVYFSSPEEAEEIVKLAEKAGSGAIALKADLSKEEDIKSVVAKTLKTFGQIDGLVHMASPYPKSILGEITMDTFGKVMSAVAGSSILLGQEVGPAMKKNAGDIKGKMIFFSDWSVLVRPYKDYLVYNAAKAAVDSITKSLALELAPDICVNAIAPGPILEPVGLTDSENREVLSKTPFARWGGAEEIAKAVLYLLDADFVTGVVLPVDGGRTIG